MEVLIDTNFIISCILKKIDFLDELENMGFKTVVPREVMQELKDLKKEKASREERVAIDLALELFEKKKVKKMTFGQGIVDEGFIIKGLEGVYIATLDKGIKSKVPNKIVIDAARKALKIERD